MVCLLGAGKKALSSLLSVFKDWQVRAEVTFSLSLPYNGWKSGETDTL